MPVPEATDSAMKSNGSDEFAGSKCDLVEMGTQDDDGGEKQKEGQFENEYSKCWPFGLLKPLKWLLLLAITILTVLCSNRRELLLSWSRCWRFVEKFYAGPYANWASPERMAFLAVFVLVLTLASSAIQWIVTKKWGKSQNIIVTIGIVDICLNLLMALILLPMLWNFMFRSIVEIHCFHPKLINNATTLEQLTEWTDRPPPYMIRDGKRIPIPDPHNYTAEYLREKKIRKSAIILRLWIDPSIAILTFLAILLNLVYAVRLLLLFKRTKVWSVDYRGMHPNCFELDLAYADFWPFGLLKAAQWILPIMALVTSLYGGFFPFNGYFLRCQILMVIISGFFFLHWLRYVQKVRLQCGEQMGKNDESKEQTETGVHQMVSMCKMDLFISAAYISGAAIPLFLFHGSVAYSHSEQNIQRMLTGSILLHFASLLLTFLLLKRHGVSNAYSGLGPNIPGISVNFSFNIHKNEPKKTEAKDEDEEEEKQQAKEKEGEFNNEKPPIMEFV